MKIKDIISEAELKADSSKMPQDQVSALKGALSMPDISINKANGSPYLQYRFGIAMAGSPDFDTPPAGAIAGDPLLTTYTDEEFEIIKAAAKMVGAGKINQLSNNKSMESPDIQKKSTTRQVGPIKLNSKTKK